MKTTENNGFYETFCCSSFAAPCQSTRDAPNKVFTIIKRLSEPSCAAQLWISLPSEYNTLSSCIALSTVLKKVLTDKKLLNLTHVSSCSGPLPLHDHQHQQQVFQLLLKSTNRPHFQSLNCHMTILVLPILKISAQYFLSSLKHCLNNASNPALFSS